MLVLPAVFLIQFVLRTNDSSVSMGLILELIITNQIGQFAWVDVIEGHYYTTVDIQPDP